MAGSVAERSPGAGRLFGEPVGSAEAAWFRVTGDPESPGLTHGLSCAVVPELPPVAACSSPCVLVTGWLPEGGWPAVPAKLRPSEAPARCSLARPWDFFRDRAWLSQSSSSSSLEARSLEAWLALAGDPAPSVGGFALEGGSPAGMECWLAGGGTEGVAGTELSRRASLVGEAGSRSKSSSLRLSQSAPPFLGWMGLEAAGGLCLEPGSPLGSGPLSAKNLLTDCLRDCRPSEEPTVG